MPAYYCPMRCPVLTCSMLLPGVARSSEARDATREGALLPNYARARQCPERTKCMLLMQCSVQT
eukprot:1557399-Rhodomonas_salina.2